MQWDIMRRAFGETGAHAGADRATPSRRYTRSAGPTSTPTWRRRSEAAGQATLDVNWRSDQGLIDAYDALLSGAKLGHEGIVYRRVRAADAHRDSRLHGAPSDAPLRVRVVPRELVKQTYNGFAPGEFGPRARRHRPRRGRRRAAVLGGRARGPLGGRATASCESSAPATSRCWCRPTGPPRRSARHSNEPACRPSSTAPGACSPPRSRPSGCGYWRRSSAPRRRSAPTPPRSRASSAGRPSGSPSPTSRRGRTCTVGCTTGRGCCASAASRR